MSSFAPLPGFKTSALRGATIVIPAVSLANLPQLAADLIVASLGLPRVGYVGDGSTVVPFAGRGDDGGLVTGGLELYGKDGLFVVQQRSPTLKTKKDAHVELVRAFVRDTAPAAVLVLTSLDAANQDDAQLLTPHQRLLPSSPVPAPLARLAALPALRLQLDPALPAPTAYPPFLPAAGLTRRLLSALADDAVPHGALAAWCVEGDNRGDAHALAAQALDVLGTPVEITEPKSWAGLFGPAEGWSGGLGADAEIYG
ncbi:hypothetical protein Q5752_006507 [Cryptotrichosporon argae]